MMLVRVLISKMKIVIKMFGDRFSSKMEVPEETGYRFSLIMTQPITKFYSPRGQIVVETHGPFDTRVHFEYIGKILDGYRVYQLIDIEKYGLRT